jgi:hypothetical protein
MSLQLTIPQTIREQLAAALLDESDLVEFLRQAPRQALAGQPDRERCHGVLPVRRALDPETSQLVEVDVVLERRGDGWEVRALNGLEA